MVIYKTNTIAEKDLTEIFMEIIQPAVNVPENNIDQVIADLLKYNKKYSVPICENTLGVMSGLTQYLNFASELDGVNFSPSMDPDFYKRGIECIDKAVQTIVITEHNPKIRDEIGYLLSSEDILSKPTNVTKPALYQ